MSRRFSPSQAVAGVVSGEEAEVVDAIRRGDESAFVELAERHRREIQLHCYRMLGSVEDAEDAVQETMLRAWRARRGFEGRSPLRAWLYRIATNACLTALERRARRLTPPDLGPATSDPRTDLVPSAEIPWLQPYPGHLLEPIAPHDTEPSAHAVSRETVELAYLAAIQHLPPRQRAVLLLRDTLGWSAQQTAALLEMSLPAVKSALQRARVTLRDHLPARRLEWRSITSPTAGELAILKRYMAAYENHDAAALTRMLREDAVHTMPPVPTWFAGRAAISAVKAWWFGPAAEGDFRALPVSANTQPAAAIYLRRHGEATFELTALEVLRVEDKSIVEISAFLPELLGGFDLPTALP